MDMNSSVPRLRSCPRPAGGIHFQKSDFLKSPVLGSVVAPTGESIFGIQVCFLGSAVAPAGGTHFQNFDLFEMAIPKPVAMGIPIFS